MSIIVKHKVFGEGTVKSIDDRYIEVDFGDKVKTFQFPGAFGPFLVTEDQGLIKKIEQAKKTAAEKSKKSVTVVEKTVPTAEIKNKKPNSISGPINRGVNSSLIGDRAQTIPVYSEKQLFELIGYMSYPGRISSIEAEVPRDGRSEIFEKMFPGQTYRPIELGDTPSGLPNKLSPQFRINFSNLDNCPALLMDNMGKGNSSCVGRINKSKFVIELVQNYGFKFGDKQDVAAIRKIAKDKGHLKDFEKGYKR